MDYRIVKGRQPRIEAAYGFDKNYATIEPHEFHAKWRDWLFWNDNTCSFYDPRIEDEAIEQGSEFGGGFTFRLNIERNRKQILNLVPLPLQMWQDDAVKKYWNGVGCMTLDYANKLTVIETNKP